MTRFASIESLRGVAAALVLFAHVKFSVIDACGSDALPDLLRPMWGACGVDLFFVISGFVIALTLDRPGATWRSFLAARIARVVPIYFVFTLICLAIPVVVCVPVTRNVLVNSFAFLPVLDSGRFSGTVHPYGWTLCFELWFYLAATVTAAIAGPRVVPACLIAIFGIGPLLWLAIGYDHPWYLPRFVLSPMVVEFALGGVAYRLTRRARGRWAGAATLAAGVAGLAIGAFRGDRLAVYSEVLANPAVALERVVCWGLPSFLIVTGTAAVERAGGWRGRRVAAALGAISFSLYLVQPIMLFAVGSLGSRIVGAAPWAVAGSAVTVVFVTATMTHRVIEQPLIATARRRLEGWLGVSRGDSIPMNRLRGRHVPGTC
jgi:exopolysaccharide production protein ExoZ